MAPPKRPRVRQSEALGSGDGSVEFRHGLGVAAHLEKGGAERSTGGDLVLQPAVLLRMDDCL